jgi:putative ABC transport system ATP-binding protein
MGDIILNVRDVFKIYMQGKIPVTALHDVTFSVEKGEFVAIMGPSGSGKSTLMGIVGCLEKPTEGKVIIDGVEVTSVSDRQLPRIRREKIGFVFQHYNLLNSLTALGNVDLAMRFSNVSKRERLERAETLLKKLGLGDRLNHRPTELSGGEQQRVSIARAMANWPAIILADEPTGEVDSKTRDAIVETFKLLKSRGQTIIVVTHDADVAKHCDRVLRIVDGTIMDSD